MQWFYVIDGKQGGPVSEAELAALVRTGQLKPSDYVWNESMGETWTRVDSVPGLVATPPATPPPVSVRTDDVSITPGQVLFWAPAGRAWDRMHAILFRPFDLGKWFLLGVTAWLATLGEQGGGTFNPWGEEWQGKWQEYANDPTLLFAEVRQYLEQNWPAVMAIAGIIVFLAIALGLLFLWLRCRGKFMFLDNVVCDRTEIAVPWRTFRQRANSLWLWQFVYGLVCMAVAAVLVAAAFVTIIQPVYNGINLAELTMPVALNFAGWTVFAVVAGYISLYLEDFVIPIMYNENLMATQAWARFLELFGEHRGRFILYGPFHLLLRTLAGGCVIVFIFATCCIAGCLIIIPVVGTVVLLPMFVYFRILSLEFLAQYGPEFLIRAKSNDA